ncbi:GNAT family N-acetyltransferase [Acinetobacter sp. 194]|uniref:GNAT family N-acetyltransferase n=1 Tax=Acinetobacter shaoyimingii TaxID=2715164 RepID=UPI00140E619C|nr:GNAT family N-acetyltransferase [Acinetobacter shaoyimingii]NHB58903.1 GNAT family N-acetyltransferase [Acinetobacter shaoyimingii]
MTIKIISLTECTYSAWLSLWQGYLTFYQTALSEQQTKLTWERLLDNNHTNMFGYAIQVDDQVVGFVHLISHDSTWTKLPYCYLQDLFIQNDYRNQGLARRLIEHSYAVCTGKFDRVYWLTHDSNHTAQLLYDRIASKTGFIQYKKALH